MDTPLQERLAAQLQKAATMCQQQGQRLTPLRRSILEVLLTEGQPLKAYDIIERMRDRGKRLTPATIYRTLDFFQQCGLAHRISSLNAFVPCTVDHDEHGALFIVCPQCAHAEELDDPELYAVMQNRLLQRGLSLDEKFIEIRGTCASCSRATRG